MRRLANSSQNIEAMALKQPDPILDVQRQVLWSGSAECLAAAGLSFLGWTLALV